MLHSIRRWLYTTFYPTRCFYLEPVLGKMRVGQVATIGRCVYECIGSGLFLQIRILEIEIISAAPEDWYEPLIGAKFYFHAGLDHTDHHWMVAGLSKNGLRIKKSDCKLYAR